MLDEIEKARIDWVVIWVERRKEPFPLLVRNIPFGLPKELVVVKLVTIWMMDEDPISLRRCGNRVLGISEDLIPCPEIICKEWNEVGPRPDVFSCDFGRVLAGCLGAKGSPGSDLDCKFISREEPINGVSDVTQNRDIIREHGHD